MLFWSNLICHARGHHKIRTSDKFELITYKTELNKLSLD